MANSTFPAPAARERTGVHPSRALIVIPQPPRRSAWRKAAAVVGRVLVVPFLLPVFAARAGIVSARATVRAAGGGVRGVGRLAWLALRGAGLLGLGLARLVGRSAALVHAAVEAVVLGALAGVAWTMRATVRFTAATTIVAAYVVAGLVAITANVVRGIGVALLAAAAAASYALVQAVRAVGLALLAVARAVVAAVVAIARAVAHAAHGVFVALRAALRFLVPARPGAAVAVAAGAYVLLAGAEHFGPFLGHALVATPAAVTVLALVGFVVAALYGFVSRTVALGLLTLLCIGGVRIGADVAARGAWGGAAAAAVFALLAGHAAWRFGRAFARPAAVRSPSITRAHRDAGIGVVGAVLGQCAVCGVWLANLQAAERTAAAVIDLASFQLVLLAVGGWLAAAVASGRHLRAAQVVLVATLTVVVVLAVAASFQAFGQGRGATPVSLALGGLLAVVATALCLVVRGRIADGSYAPVASPSAAAA